MVAHVADRAIGSSLTGRRTRRAIVISPTFINRSPGEPFNSGVSLLLLVMRRTFLNVVLFTLCLGGCAHKQAEVVRTPAPQETPRQPAPEARVAVKRGGWQIPGLEGRRVLKRTEIKSDDAAAPTMYLTEYALGAPKRGQHLIQRSLFSEDERRALRLLPYDLAITDLWGYDVKGRKYCYMLRAHPPGIGALQTVRFCDRDGDGTFESAEAVKYVGLAPEMPGWARGAAKDE